MLKRRKKIALNVPNLSFFFLWQTLVRLSCKNGTVSMNEYICTNRFNLDSKKIGQNKQGLNIQAGIFATPFDHGTAIS
jgi:hypothetical protein